MHDTEDPIVQAQQMIADARQAFAKDVDELLGQLRVFTQAWGDGGTITLVRRNDALLALRELVLEKFALHMPRTRSLSEVLIEQLTAENTALRATQMELLAACKHIVQFHDQVFPLGHPLQVNGQPVDHTVLNEACALAHTAIAKAEKGSANV